MGTHPIFESDFDCLTETDMTGKAFHIEVQTADEGWAGTDNTVQISMAGPVSGVTKDTGMMELDKKGVNDHERGNLDKYVIEKSPYPLEKIDSLTVLKNGNDDWNLDYIKVTYQPPEGAKQVYTFNFKQVIKGNKSVMCSADAKAQKSHSRKAFHIEVKTADKTWAGTDNTVKISMSGPVNGVTMDTGKLKLDTKWVNDHERNQLCKYAFDESPQFDKIDSLTVFKNGSDDWNLEYIKVTYQPTKGDAQVYTFKFNQVIKGNKPVTCSSE